jgi:hypothetical protein
MNPCRVVVSEAEISLPEEAMAISAALENGQLSVWWIVPNKNAERRKYQIFVVPAGVPFTGTNACFLDTVSRARTRLHVFVEETATLGA